MGRFYSPSNKNVTDGDIAYAEDLNKVNSATDSGFTSVESEIDVLTLSISSITDSAEFWAIADQGVNPDPLQPTEYSSKANAQEAEAWASGTAGVSTLADGVSTIPFSASEKASEASGYATAALGSQNAASASAAAAAASESAASTSETNSGVSEVNALASENKAYLWANEAEDVEVDPGEYSAYHWAQKALTAAGVQSIVGTVGEVDVDNTDPSNPVLSISATYTATVDGKEDDLGNPSIDGQVLSSTAAGVRSWIDSYSGLTLVDVTASGGSSGSASGNFYRINSSGGTHTLFLPASPDDGDEIGIGDAVHSFSTNAVVLSRNGNNIMGVADNLTLDISGTSLVLQYRSATTDWVITKCTPVV